MNKQVQTNKRIERLEKVESELNKIQRVLDANEEFNPESPNYLRFVVKMKGLSGGQLKSIQKFAEILSIDGEHTYPLNKREPYPYIKMVLEIPKEFF